MIDDGSFDQTVFLVEEYAKLDKRIHLHRKENGGVSSARNYGMSIAKGEYIAFLDADDFLEIDAYRSMLEAMLADDSDIVFL